MDIIKPKKNRIYVYSKSNCDYCNKIKILLREEDVEFVVVDCDKYLEDNKDMFLETIKEFIGFEYKKFPMVFIDGKFIGGYSETFKYLEKNKDDFF